MESDNSPQQSQFLQKDYELKINFLTAHFSRIWTRFNFFLVLESGLSAAMWIWFKEKGSFVTSAAALAWIGAVSCLCWYVFGAQDRYLVAVYRKQVESAGMKIAETLGMTNYVYVGDQSAKINKNIYQWRFTPISTTKLAAWFPLLVLAYWIVMIALTSK